MGEEEHKPILVCCFDLYQSGHQEAMCMISEISPIYVVAEKPDPRRGYLECQVQGRYGDSGSLCGPFFSAQEYGTVEDLIYQMKEVQHALCDLDPRHLSNLEVVVPIALTKAMPWPCSLAYKLLSNFLKSLIAQTIEKTGQMLQY